MEMRAYWMVNPAIRLRFELSYTYRKMTYSDEALAAGFENNRGDIFGVGLRTNIFNRYYDF
jgi:hypothetical protein